METLPAEDRAPAPPVRRVPRGLLAAAILATAVVVIAVFVAVRSAPPASNNPADTDTPFTIRNGLGKPDVDLTGKQLPDLAYATFDDKRESLAKYAGKPLVINFWSSTCPPCVTEMPDFQKVHEQLGDKVAFLGLDVQDGVDNGRFMLEKTGVKYDVGRDPNGEVMVKLGGIVLPTTVVVAADGTIKRVNPGQMSADELKQAIEGPS